MSYRISCSRTLENSRFARAKPVSYCRTAPIEVDACPGLLQRNPGKRVAPRVHTSRLAWWEAVHSANRSGYLGLEKEE